MTDFYELNCLRGYIFCELCEKGLANCKYDYLDDNIYFCIDCSVCENCKSIHDLSIINCYVCSRNCLQCKKCFDEIKNNVNEKLTCFNCKNHSLN